MGVVSNVASLSSIVTTALAGVPSAAPPVGSDSATVTVSSTPSTAASSRIVSGTVAVVWPSAKLTVWSSGVKSVPGVAVAGVVVVIRTATAPSAPLTRSIARLTGPPPSAPRNAAAANWRAPGWAAVPVVIVIDQPPPIDPVSPATSSTTNSCHCPLGLLPLKTPSVVAELGGGAGAGNRSGAPALTLVGWNVPVPSAPVAGIGPGAWSSNVSVPLTGKPVSPLTSDITTRFWPAGPTSRTS